jgi:hypothetical protein
LARPTGAAICGKCPVSISETVAWGNSSEVSRCALRRRVRSPVPTIKWTVFIEFGAVKGCFVYLAQRKISLNPVLLYGLGKAVVEEVPFEKVTPAQQIKRILCKVQSNDAIQAESDMCICV